MSSDISHKFTIANNQPKVAIFYDWLNQWGGAERVLLNLLKIYPQADLYCLVYNPQKTNWLPKKIKIFSSILNKFPYAKSNPIFYTPFYDITLEQFNFKSYDIVISTTSTIGHCLLTPPETLFVTYFHNINRHLYKYNFLKFYQKIDKIYSHRPDAILCNSKTVYQRILDKYQVKAKIINPGVDTDFFKPSSISNQKTQSYFLIVSRLVNHKKIDIAINAFKNLPYQLIIIGSGREEKKLQLLTQKQSNIKFVHSVTDDELLSYYQKSEALICPQLEDFGLAAIEAQACGKPVIAYGRGGNTETVLNLKTGIFFLKQNQESLINAINIFKKTKFNSDEIRQHALKFSDSQFMINFKQTIDHLWQKH